MHRTPRLLSLPFLFLILLSLPAYCDTEAILIPVTQKFRDGQPMPPGNDLAALRIPDLDDLKSVVSPSDALAVGYGRSVKVKRPDTSKMPGRLALTGLLLIPLDGALSKAIPRIDADRETDGITEAVNKLGTPEVLIGALGGMYLLGDKEDKNTAKLAVSALANASLMTGGMKLLSGRARPYTLDEGEFTGPEGRKGYSSFPSGHTAAAFAVATVLANKHPKQKWLYYGLAAAVGAARVRKSAHFPSDVLVGAGVGIYAGNKALQGGPRILSIRF